MGLRPFNDRFATLNFSSALLRNVALKFKYVGCCYAGVLQTGAGLLEGMAKKHDELFGVVLEEWSAAGVDRGDLFSMARVNLSLRADDVHIRG